MKMMKKIITIVVLVLISTKFIAQTNEQNETNFYINVFINESKDIRIESNLVKFENIDQKVKKIMYDRTFKLDENVTYRVFADKNLMLGYIMDVEQKMFDGYNQNARRERYLLDTVYLELDGPNWLKKLEGVKFDTIKG